MNNQRSATAAVTAVIGVVLLTAGCSGTDSSTDKARSSLTPIAVPQAEVTATVDGAPLPGVDLSQLFCSRGGSIILTGQDPLDGRPGLGALLEPGDPPTLGHVSFGIDGMLYSAKPGKGTATVTEDGDRIAIRGTAESDEPTSTPLTKTFDIAATCT